MGMIPLKRNPQFCNSPLIITKKVINRSEKTGKIMRVVLAGVIILALLITTFPVYPHINYMQEHSVQGKNAVEDSFLWSSTKRITWLGNSTNPVVKSGENNTYDVVWQDYRNGNWEIYYTKLTEEGFKLLNDSRITYYSGDDINPRIEVSGSRIFIVWQRFLNTHWTIFFSRLLYSNENISIEIPPKSVRDNGDNCTNPSFGMDSQGFLHLAWQEFINDHWVVMYDKIDQNGNSVFSPIMVSNSHYNSTQPKLVVDNYNHVHILWIDDTPTPGYSIMYKGLDCCGYFITPIRRISVVSPKSTLSVDYGDNRIYVVFSCSRENESYEPIFTSLNTTGITLVDDRNLTFPDGVNSITPNAIEKNGRLFVVWNDIPSGSIKSGMYNGTGVKIDRILVLNENSSEKPEIAVNSNSLVVIWSEKYDNGTYIFSKFAKFPDLYVKYLKIDSVNNNTVNISVNMGITWDIGREVDYILMIDNSTVIQGNISLSSQEILNFSLRMGGGYHYIKFILDPQNSVFEANEYNNYAEEYVFVREYSFQVYVPNKCEISPGNYTNLSVSIVNDGNWNDTYYLHFNYSPNLFIISPQTLIKNLPPQKEITFNITIYAYENLSFGHYNITLMVNSSSGKNYVNNVTVVVERVVNFQVYYNPIVYSLPNRAASINFTISNLGNCNDTYLVKIIETKTWLINYNDVVSVPANTQRNMNFTVYIPNSTAAYTKDIIYLHLSPRLGNVSKNISILLMVAPHHSAIATVTYLNGSEGKYTAIINVVNTGNIMDFYNFNVSGPLLHYSIISPSSGVVKSGENITVEIDLLLPLNITAGTYPLIFHVLRGNTTLTTLPINIDVKPSPNYQVTVKRISGEEKVLFDVQIKNTGNVLDAITVIPHFSQIKNSTWIFTYNGKNYTNQTVVILNPGENVTVRMELKNKLRNGVYSLTLMFFSKFNLNKNITLKFRVGEIKKSVWDTIWNIVMDNILYIVIGVIAVVAIIAYLYYRK